MNRVFGAALAAAAGMKTAAALAAPLPADDALPMVGTGGNGHNIPEPTMVQKATIKLADPGGNGASFTISTHSDERVKSYANDDRLNVDVQSARLNGKPLNRPWITHDELIHGGVLELKMGVLPNKARGTQLN